MCMISSEIEDMQVSRNLLCLGYFLQESNVILCHSF